MLKKLLFLQMLAGAALASPIDCLNDGYQDGCGPVTAALCVQAFDLGDGVVALRFNAGEAVPLRVRGDDVVRAYRHGDLILFEFDRTGILAAASQIGTANLSDFHGARLLSASRLFDGDSLLSGVTPPGYQEEYRTQVITGEFIDGGSRVTLLMRLSRIFGGDEESALSEPPGFLQPFLGGADVATQVTPEPMSYLLIGAGLGAIGLYRKRRA